MEFVFALGLSCHASFWQGGSSSQIWPEDQREAVRSFRCGDGETPLFWALRAQASLEAIESLLEAGVPVGARDETGASVFDDFPDLEGERPEIHGLLVSYLWYEERGIDYPDFFQ